MAWFQDLEPCTYFGDEYADDLSAVGWLARGKPYASGEVPDEFFFKLGRLLKRPWAPIIFCGSHSCEFCRFTGGVGTRVTTPRWSDVYVPARSCVNLFVPGNGTIYVSPESIAHYVDAHEYRPPDEYIAAVLECPRMSSKEYFGAIRANGGRFGRAMTKVTVT